MLDTRKVSLSTPARLRTGLVLQRHPNLVFWLCFLALNGLLFLPLYLLNLEETRFLPFALAPAGGLGERLRWLAVERSNLDPFRLNLELSLLILLWVRVKWMRRRTYRMVVCAVYFSALAYTVYESAIVSIYQVDPIFYNQYPLIADGLPFLLKHMHLPAATYAAAAVALAGGLWAVTAAIRALLAESLADGLNRWTKLALAGVAAAALASLFTIRVGLAGTETVVSSFAYKLERNVAESLRLYRAAALFDDQAARQVYDYTDFRLAQKPNIYLILVESYGSVLYKRPDYRRAYVAHLEGMEETLAEGGWHAASTLSEAPTWGGGSWMGYTSALFGLRVDSHPFYLSLFNKYQNEPYPHLGNYLRDQGYANLRLSSLSSELKEHEWLRYKNFFGVDQWLRYRDLDYVGPEYGWGPAPPDQFALNFAQDYVEEHVEQPFLLFFITQNSHYPWVPLPEVVAEWRTLNTRPAEGAPEAAGEFATHEDRRAAYLDAVRYQLDFLADFILQRADEDAIFVLLGDHQPPRVSRHSDGWDTPLHIISRDRAFVDALDEYGFVTGLDLAEPVATLHHEGFYSLFVRALLAAYGEDPETLPPYLPDGATLAASLPVPAPGFGFAAQ